MASMTLKEMVVDILNDMDSDPLFTVTGGEDITATEESRQIVQIIKQTYFKIIDSREWPFLANFFQLTPIGASRPHEMTLGSDVTRVKYIKYNTSATSTPTFTLMNYLEPQKFMNIVDARDSQAANVTAVSDSTSIPINVITDAAPTYYTIMEDRRVIFDAYDSAVDTTSLLAAKSQGYGQVYPSFTETDAFVPTLPVDMYTMLVEEAKSTAFAVLKQASNPKADFASVSLRSTQKDGGWKGRKNFPIEDKGLEALGQQQPTRGGQ